jgi:hypothetical protein
MYIMLRSSIINEDTYANLSHNFVMRITILQVHV